MAEKIGPSIRLNLTVDEYAMIVEALKNQGRAFFENGKIHNGDFVVSILFDLGER